MIPTGGSCVPTTRLPRRVARLVVPPAVAFRPLNRLISVATAVSTSGGLLRRERCHSEVSFEPSVGPRLSTRTPFFSKIRGFNPETNSPRTRLFDGI